MTAESTSAPARRDAILGCLLGGAAGDAMGLASEGMTRRKIAARWPVLRHRLVFGHGMFSDDTEHTLLTAAALLRHGGDAAAFRKDLARSLRRWFLCLPPATGMATAKACLRLCIGFSPARSGVRSAGNGAAMRSAVIGVVFRDDPGKRREFTRASCRITHTDPRAEEAALLVAEAAALAARRAPTAECLTELRALTVSAEMTLRLGKLEESLSVGAGTAEYAASIGCGEAVSGFAPNTAAVALYAWLRHRGEYEAPVRAVIACGGDTDTVAAITGGICGAETGPAGIPAAWIDGVRDWPLSVRYVRRMAAALADGHPPGPRLFAPAVVLRNILFLLVVLVHGFRRLFPPY